MSSETANLNELMMQAYDAIQTYESACIDAQKDAAILGAIKDGFDGLKAKIKGASEAIDSVLIRWMTENNIQSCDIGGDKRIVKSQVKTNRFDTQEIYKALDVSQEIVDVLPANPDFRVSAVKVNPKIAHLFWEESKDKIEIKIADKRYLR